MYFKISIGPPVLGTFSSCFLIRSNRRLTTSRACDIKFYCYVQAKLIVKLSKHTA